MGEGRRDDWIERMRVVVMTSAGAGGAGGHREVAGAALKAGCRAVQLRDKEMDDGAFTEVARKLGRACREAGALFFINDRVEVAAEVDCDGVHLGVDDMKVTDAREMLGPDAIIGYSPEGFGEALIAVRHGADYIGVGPVFATASKPDAGRAIGLDRLSDYCWQLTVPVIAVGGMNEGNAASAVSAGAAGVAVLSAVVSAGDMEAAARAIIEKVGDLVAGW